MADTSVKYFHSDMVGAPVLNGTAGAMIAVLDACLVDGFGLKTIDSITVASGVATASISTGHSFVADSVALVSGCSVSALNGEKKIISITTNTIVFDATGVSDQTITAGGMTVKFAPAGWTKAFSGTNLAAYRTVVGQSLGRYLWVNDAGTTETRVIGYEDMTDINTGTGMFPTSLQLSGGLYWPKSNVADTSARKWMVFADKAAMYIFLSPHVTYTASHGTVFGFGDPKEVTAGDVYATCIYGHTAASGATSSSSTLSGEVFNGNPTITTGKFQPRPATQIGGSSNFGTCIPGVVPSLASGTPFPILSGSTSLPTGYSYPHLYVSAYPSVVDGGLLLTPILQFSSNSLRGVSAGVYGSPTTCATTLTHRDLIDGSGILAGRKLLSVRLHFPAGVYNTVLGGGVGFVDITGPWR